MRIIIVGASRFGRATARALLDGGHDVVIIDTDADKLERLHEDLDCGLIHGDGAVPPILRDAYADGADALVLLTNEDDVNILAALVGRSVGFPRVIPQIVRSELVQVCEELGLEDLITPHATIARSIVRVLEAHDDAAMDLRQHAGLNVLAYDVGDDLAGRTVADIDLPRHTRIAAVMRGEDDDWLDDSTPLDTGDRVIAIATDGARSELDAVFKRKM